ncbi:unnamed protein product [Effrenium voratum]|nr:unnamed protein product [Effrenium voratum]
MSLWTPALWAAQAALARQPLRIFVASPELWEEICDKDWGYAYHLERWFHRLLLEHLPATLTNEAESADFVYVPHCAMNVYLAWKQEALSSSDDATRAGAGAAGDALHGPARRAAERYLVGVLRRAFGSPAVRSCQARFPGCKLLFALMAFCRDELPAFHRAAPSAVVITTCGVKTRDLRRQGCACREHCLRQVAGPWDVVVPWNIAHNSSSTQARFAGGTPKRRLLAFFAGANTSCSRSELVRRWGDAKDMVIQGRAMAPGAFARHGLGAKFCPVLDGHWPSTQRLPAVVVKGCVPLLISNRLRLPWDDLINWTVASLWLSESRIKDLAQVLRGVSPKQLEDMQRHLPQLAQALDYHSTCFHVLLLAALAARRGR